MTSTSSPGNATWKPAPIDSIKLKKSTERTKGIEAARKMPVARFLEEHGNRNYSCQGSEGKDTFSESRSKHKERQGIVIQRGLTQSATKTDWNIRKEAHRAARSNHSHSSLFACWLYIQNIICEEKQRKQKTETKSSEQGKIETRRDNDF